MRCRSLNRSYRKTERDKDPDIVWILVTLASLISFTHYKGPTAEVLLVILYTLKYSQFRKSLALSQEHTKADSLYPLDPIFSLFTVSSFLCSDGTVYDVKQQPDACREQSVSGCYFLSQNRSAQPWRDISRCAESQPQYRPCSCPKRLPGRHLRRKAARWGRRLRPCCRKTPYPPSFP